MWRFALCLLVVVVEAAAGTREVYVWQRQFGPEVVASLHRFAPQIDACCVLAAEVGWNRGALQVFRRAPNYAELATLDRPVGLALRIGPYGGPFTADDLIARRLIGLARSLIEEANRAGLRVAELQIDFDCAESKLAGYRTWLGAFRGVIGPTPLVFTALPSWLRRESEFAALAHAADGFVLQVHSLEKPAGFDAPFTLCDPARAREWVRQAARIGVPFRVALPTYGYLVAFDAAGKFFALSAEGPPPAWPAGTHMRAVRSDPVALAQLVSEWNRMPPSNYTGVIWFRLPVEGDRLNWDATTLEVVLRGATPRTTLALAVERSEPGLAEIVVANSGETSEPLPERVALRWPTSARFVAGDGLRGFRLDVRDAEGQGTLVATSVPPDAFVAPGRRVKIAWLRFAHDSSLDVSLLAPDR